MLVEAAFIFPVLVVLIFAIIEYGLVFKDYLTITASTRSGARTASAMARQVGYDTTAAGAVASSLRAKSGGDTPLVLEIYLADPSNGLPCANAPCVQGIDETLPSATCGHCSYFTWDAVNFKWNPPSPAMWTPSGSASSQDACAADPPDTLGVYLKVSHQMQTGLFGSTKTLTDRTLVRLEPQPSTQGSGCKN